MGRYDYQCSNKRCGKIREEIHGMLERPCVVCMRCGCECFKLISVSPDQIFAPSIPLYDFVDHKTTPNPVRIKSKTQWHEHLKRIGQIEAPNTPPTINELAAVDRTKKMVAKRELREAVVKVVKNKRHIREVKQKIMNMKGGK